MKKVIYSRAKHTWKRHKNSRFKAQATKDILSELGQLQQKKHCCDLLDFHRNIALTGLPRWLESRWRSRDAIHRNQRLQNIQVFVSCLRWIRTIRRRTASWSISSSCRDPTPFTIFTRQVMALIQPFHSSAAHFRSVESNGKDRVQSRQ